MMAETTRDETFCGICGHLLTRPMIAAEFDGKFADYEAREVGTMNFAICSECRAKILEIDDGGLDAARRRAREMRDGDGAGTVARP